LTDEEGVELGCFEVEREGERVRGGGEVDVGIVSERAGFKEVGGGGGGGGGHPKEGVEEGCWWLGRRQREGEEEGR